MVTGQTKTRFSEIRLTLFPSTGGSSIYMYKNDVGVMYSHSKKQIFFLLHKLHDHIHPPLPTSFLYIYDI
jgi:hypothetical protein